MNEFTKGVWSVGWKNTVGIKSKEDDQTRGMTIPLVDVYGQDAIANADLIATCFTSATKLAEAGYDAQAVMEALPEIVLVARSAAMEQGPENPRAVAFLARIRPEASHE